AIDLSVELQSNIETFDSTNDFRSCLQFFFRPANAANGLAAAASSLVGAKSRSTTSASGATATTGNANINSSSTSSAGRNIASASTSSASYSSGRAASSA